MEVRTTGVPVIGARELRRAADILRSYKQGKQNLERRIIADEDWWKLPRSSRVPICSETVW